PRAGVVFGLPPPPATSGGPVWEARKLERAALARGTFTGYRRIAITPFLVRGKLAGGGGVGLPPHGGGGGGGLAVQLPAAGRGGDGGPGGGHAGDRPGHWPAV